MLDEVAKIIPDPPKEIRFSSGVEAAAQEILSLPPRKIMHRLIADQESEPALYAGLQLVEARLAAVPEIFEEVRSVALDPYGNIETGPLLASLRAGARF